jgi:hypothetical protein
MMVAIAVFGVIQVSLFIGRSLTIDEPFVANMVHLDWSGMFEMVWMHETPLYHALLKIWVSLLGESEIALRSFSVLCLVLTITTVGCTAKRLNGVWAGCAAALLMSVSYLGLQHAGTARMYALLSLQVAVAVLLCFRILELFDPEAPSSSQGDQILCCALLVGVNLTGLLNHSIYLFFLVASSLAALLVSRQVFLVLTLCNLLSLALHLGIWGPHLGQLARTSATSWMQVPGLADLGAGVLRLWDKWRTLLLAAYLLVVSVARWQTAKQFLRSKEGSVLGTMLILLVALPLLVSQVRPVYYAVRTPALFLPIACVFSALLMAHLGRPRFSTVVLLVLAVASVWTCLTAAPGEPGAGPARASVRYVVGRARTGDTVISGEFASNEVAYYLRRFGAEGRLEHLTFPASMYGRPDWFRVAGASNSQESLTLEAKHLVEHVLAGDQACTVWFFYGAYPGHTDSEGVLKRQLDQRMTLVETLDLRGSFFEQVLVYARLW